jgi:hypothetical protein
MFCELKNYIQAVFLFLYCAVVSAQSDTLPGTHSAPLWYKKYLRESAYLQGRSLQDIGSIKAHKWEFIGPAIQPTELNPGGRAVPAYAVNRGNGTGRINYIYVHPKITEKVWACSPTGGVWFTKDGGELWEEGGTDALPISGVSSVAVNIKRPREWVISTGDGDDQFMFSDGIWRTRNNGKSYENINGLDPATALPFANDGSPTFIGEVVCKPDDFGYLIVASNKGLWICENANEKIPGQYLKNLFRRGRTNQRWKRVSEGVFYDVEIVSHPTVGENIIVAAGEKLVVSYDGGQTWETMPTPDYDESAKYPFLRMSVEYSTAMPYFLLVAMTSSEAASASAIGNSSLRTFDLKTKSWTNNRPLKGEVSGMNPTRARAFCISPTNPQLILSANVQPVYRSIDGGATFNKTERNQMHDDVHHLEFSSDGKTVWAAHDGGVSVSYDEGVHWSKRDDGIGAANVFGVSTSQTNDMQVVFGAYDTGGNLLRDKKWQHVSWGDGFETITSPANPDIMFTTMQNGLIQGSKSGGNFDEAKSANSRSEWHSWIKMHPTQHNTIYSSGAKVMRSKNLGDTWESIFDCKKQDTAIFTIFKFFLSGDHPNVMYLYALDEETKVNPQIWMTRNLLEDDPAKIVWEKLPYLPITGWIMSIAMDAADENKFWLLYNRPEGDGKIWYYDGRRYNDKSNNLGGAKCESMIMQRGPEQRLYVGSNFGIFTRSKNDNEWTLLQGLPGTFIKTMDINYTTGKLIVGTFGRGIWQGDLIVK